MLQGNGYSNLGAPSSGQPQHSHAPQEPHPQASPFQHANGHLHAPPANPDLGSGFSSGHSSGDLAQIPSPPPSQVSGTAVRSTQNMHDRLSGILASPVGHTLCCRSPTLKSDVLAIPLSD